MTTEPVSDKSPGSEKPKATIASPCVGVCQIDRETKFCLGCWRTLQEIAHWSRYDDTERLAVLDRLRARQTEAGANRRRVTRRRRAAND